ncbi:MAG: hypothetical protein M5U28_20635 [Sandaracinaceae bacterium]|nr:hypothetical protein [Sandaracinaceae bacterium]
MRRFELSGGLASAILALSFVGVLSACDDEPDEDAGRDAAVAVDAAVPVDAAVRDAGLDARAPRGRARPG